MERKVVFLAMPSRGTVENGVVKKEVNAFVARLHELHPYGFICPIIQDYQVVPYLKDTKPTWKEWSHRCKALIAVSDEVWVLKYPEWNCSIGVAEEIEFAINSGVAVRYIDV